MVVVEVYAVVLRQTRQENWHPIRRLAHLPYRNGHWRSISMLLLLRKQQQLGLLLVVITHQLPLEHQGLPPQHINNRPQEALVHLPQLPITPNPPHLANHLLQGLLQPALLLPPPPILSITPNNYSSTFSI